MAIEQDSHPNREPSTQQITIVLPLMGEGVTEATFVKSLKKVGESVKKDEPLFEVSTDKVDTEIPSPADGTLLRIVAQEGQLVSVSSTVMILQSSNALAGGTHHAGDSFAPTDQKDLRPKIPSSAAEPLPSKQTELSSHPGSVKVPTSDLLPPATRDENPKESAMPPTMDRPLTPQKAHQPETAEEPVPRVSPLVRKIAKERQLDLSNILGSGLGGRITLKDLDQLPPPGAPSKAQIPPQVVTTGGELKNQGALETKMIQGVETLDGVPVRREKMSKMRVLIAEHMVRSVRTSPHVTTVFEIDMHRVDTLRAAAFDTVKKSQDVNLTYTAFFAYATVQAIKRHPLVNVSVDRDEILWKDSINLGIAVAIETGLIVPVIRNAGDLNLVGIARQVQSLAQKARNKKLTPDDVQGGTFSITNPGMFGSLVSAPIINQPQVAILSIGAIVRRPVVLSLPQGLDSFSSTNTWAPPTKEKTAPRNEMIAIRPMVQVGLTFDHRVIDGEGGAQFLATLKGLLENFPEAAVMGA